MYRPHCVRSVLTTSVKILPYRPPVRLIRAKYGRPIWEKKYLSWPPLPLRMSTQGVKVLLWSLPLLPCEQLHNGCPFRYSTSNRSGYFFERCVGGISLPASSHNFPLRPGEPGFFFNDLDANCFVSSRSFLFLASFSVSRFSSSLKTNYLRARVSPLLLIPRA